MFFRVVQCINHVFQYENQYMVTPEIRIFRENPLVRQELMEFLYAETDNKKRKTFSEVFKLISEFNHGTTVRQICLRHRSDRI